MAVRQLFQSLNSGLFGFKLGNGSGGYFPTLVGPSTGLLTTTEWNILQWNVPAGFLLDPTNPSQVAFNDPAYADPVLGTPLLWLSSPDQGFGIFQPDPNGSYVYRLADGPGVWSEGGGLNTYLSSGVALRGNLGYLTTVSLNARVDQWSPGGWTSLTFDLHFNENWQANYIPSQASVDLWIGIQPLVSGGVVQGTYDGMFGRVHTVSLLEKGDPSLNADAASYLNPFTSLSYNLNAYLVTAIDRLQADGVDVTGMEDLSKWELYSVVAIGNEDDGGAHTVVDISDFSVTQDTSKPVTAAAIRSAMNDTANSVHVDPSPVGTFAAQSAPAELASAGALTLAGAHGQYLIALDPSTGNAVIRDTIPGRDGTQAIANLQTMTFADGTARFDASSNTEKVARLYAAVLQRAPDAAGLDHWVAQLDSGNLGLDGVALCFLNSAEFTRAGPLDNEAFIDQLYLGALHRAPDASGKQNWITSLNTGTSREQVVIGFSESLENKVNTIGSIGDSHVAEAYRLYQAAFGRAPDAADLTQWSGLLDSGTMPIDVARDLVQTADFSNLAAGLDNKSLVDMFYQIALHRPADPGGEQYWVGLLEAGAPKAQILLGFSDSFESRLVTSQLTHDGWLFLPS